MSAGGAQADHARSAARALVRSVASSDRRGAMLALNAADLLQVCMCLSQALEEGEGGLQALNRGRRALGADTGWTPDCPGELAARAAPLAAAVRNNDPFQVERAVRGVRLMDLALVLAVIAAGAQSAPATGREHGRAA